ncbi:MAG: DUF452 family protein [Helicobacter sp.]|nr:DUF452 family protein [Helicobacter sp.]
MRASKIKASKKNSKKILLFFSGFGLGINYFADFLSNFTDRFDEIYFVDNYLDFELDFSFLNGSKEEFGGDSVWVMAFSMGVSIFSRLDFREINVVYKMAINGTMQGISKDFGIHPQVFLHTQKHLDFKAFLRAIYGHANFKYFDFDIAILKQELKAIYEFIMQNEIKKMQWDLAVISTEDAIFERKILLNAWEKSALLIREIQSPHFCFDSKEFRQIFSNI